MELTFRQIEDANLWNNFVLSQSRYSFVQSYEYGEVLPAIVNEIRKIGIYEKDNELIGLLQIGIIKAKRGSYLRLRHGPIIAVEYQTKEIIMKVVEYLENICKIENLAFIRIQPFIDHIELFRKLGFRSAPSHNLDAEHTLQLNIEKFRSKNVENTRSAVLNNMRKNTRYYIRKAEKEGVRVQKDNANFDAFYSILKNTASRQDYTTWPRKYFENLFQTFNSDQLSLYFAEVEGQKVGIGLFLDFGKYRFYLEGGMDMKYSKYYPAYAIQWRSISDAIEKGIEIYDFWGGVAPKDDKGESIKNYPWAGINLFKAGFGGEEVSMLHPHDKPVTRKYWITWLIERVEKWRRGY